MNLRLLKRFLNNDPILINDKLYYDSKFLSNFKGNKRMKQKKAKKFMINVLKNIVLPYMRTR